MKSIEPKDISVAELYGYLTDSIAPRPIAFASTIDKNGNPNLAPFSFFNVVGINPPVLVFSPAKSSRDLSLKDTLLNCKETKEVVINIVNYDIVHQMSLTSTAYDKGINEFEKSGLTMLKSDLVKPFRVKESPVQYECKVTDIIALGQEGGAGNLIVAEVVKLHISNTILDDENHIDQYKIDLVARAGGNFYTRAKDGFFEIPKPIRTLGIGVDALSDKIRNSNILTGNDLGKLGNVEKLPTEEEISDFINTNKIDENLSEKEKQQKAQELLHEDKTIDALKLLMS